MLTPPSDNDSFDSELVRSTIQSLSLEDELVYRLTIGDYETGLTHTLQVQIQRVTNSKFK